MQRSILLPTDSVFFWESSRFMSIAKLILIVIAMAKGKLYFITTPKVPDEFVNIRFIASHFFMNRSNINSLPL